jgi:hypothetical protein
MLAHQMQVEGWTDDQAARWLRRYLRSEIVRIRAGEPPVGATVSVPCKTCGEPTEISARNERLHRQRGTQPLCEVCRALRGTTPGPREWAWARSQPEAVRAMAMLA